MEGSEVDIFFNEKYGKLCEEIEGGTCIVFKHCSSLGAVRHIFIQREIPIRLDNHIYYDLITPFRYGGPLILNCNPGKREMLAAQFEEAFSQYCAENRVVSEFVRFHPLFNNADDFKTCYQVQKSRTTVGTDLKSDPICSQFSKSARRNIRQALRAGVQYRVIRNPSNLERLKKIYFETLTRKQASSFHYFPHSYFSHCLELFRDNLLLVEALYQGKVIAASLSFLYGQIIHIHLSGTLTEFLHLSPAYLLRYGLTLWGKEHGYHLIHHGGGIRSGKNDSLYQFKQRFGKLRFEMKVGKKVWNRQAYERLCAAQGVADGGFFPAYRKGE